MSKNELILDSSQISSYLECPQLWHYSYNENLQILTSGRKDEAMQMGTYGHKLLEIYYKGRANGHSPSAMIERAFAFDPFSVCHNCQHPKQDHQSEAETKETRVCSAADCDCTQFLKTDFNLPTEKIAIVRERFKVYVYTYINRDIEPLNAESVEIGFSHPIYEDSERIYVLEGRIDLLGKLAGSDAFLDHKFQLRARDLYNKSIQFKNYALVTESSLGIINYIRFNKEVTPDTYRRAVISMNGIERNYWKIELLKIFHEIYDAKFNNRIRKNWGACSGKFGYPCNFTHLCEEMIPAIVDAKKETLYQLKPEWRPW